MATMFCNQCEQAKGGTGCDVVGICGKDPDVQSLQETLLYGLKGMAAYAHRTAQEQSSIPIAFSCNSLHCCHIRRSRAGHDREADAGPIAVDDVAGVDDQMRKSHLSQRMRALPPDRGSGITVQPASQDQASLAFLARLKIECGFVRVFHDIRLHN